MDDKTPESQQNKVPRSIGISEKIRNAYPSLGLVTPFATWAEARLWEGIEAERKERIPSKESAEAPLE